MAHYRDLSTLGSQPRPPSKYLRTSTLKRTAVTSGSGRRNGKKTLGKAQRRVLDLVKSRQFRSRYEVAKFLAGRHQKKTPCSKFRGVYKTLASLERYGLIQVTAQGIVASKRADLAGTGTYFWQPDSAPLTDTERVSPPPVRLQSTFLAKASSRPHSEISRGTLALADPLFTENVTIARRIAVAYCGGDVALFDDLFNEALIGLHKAVLRFREHGHPAFPAYLKVRIRGAVLDGLRSLRHGGRRIEEPYFVEISESPDPETGIQLCDPNSPDVLELLAYRERWQRLISVLETLQPRSRQIFERTFLNQEPIDRVGDDLNISAARVSQIRSAALAEIRRKLNGDARS